VSELVILSLVVFAITLTITKSRIFASSREFIKERYEASFVNGQQPSWFHRWWNATWRCSMCLGFWVSVVLCWFYPTEVNYVIAVLAVYGLNWLWHCLENLLFFGGEYFEKHSRKNV